MEQQIQYTLHLHYKNGKHEVYSLTVKVDELRQPKELLQLFNAPVLPLEVDGKLVIIPVSNIERVEIAPPPEHLPRTVITNVRQIQ